MTVTPTTKKQDEEALARLLVKARTIALSISNDAKCTGDVRLKAADISKCIENADPLITQLIHCVPTQSKVRT